MGTIAFKKLYLGNKKMGRLLYGEAGGSSVAKDA